MRSYLVRAIRRGVEQVFEHPQLWLTIVVAVAIIGSFAYVADRFIGIARDAQERLVNVRVGALQDAFAPLAAAFANDPATLRTHMRSIVANNPTITSFEVLNYVDGKWDIVNAVDEKTIGNTVVGQDFFLSLALADPTNSFTVEEVRGDERYFRTARAIVNASSSVIGIALTKQSLSEADRSIAASIRASIVILVAILLFLLFLFFHHARIIDYTALYRRLQEVDNLKDDFISMASHELRTPLTIIRGYTAELKERKGEQTARSMEMLDLIDRSAANLNLLISDMLDVARIEQGRMPMNLAQIDPSNVVREVYESLRPVAAQKGLSIVCETGSGAIISADPDRLRQVMTNLVSNAIKYSDKGEITVSVKAENDTLAIRVSDTGIGMTADERAKLFGKFQRAAGERVRSEVGTGLGLWITKQLVEAMRGQVSVESIKGVGSHFIITFPLVSPSAK